jgi:hypothetical protein
MFRLRRSRDPRTRRTGEWRALVRALGRPGRLASQLDEDSFRSYVQRHVLSDSQLQAQTGRRPRPPDAGS